MIDLPSNYESILSKPPLTTFIRVDPNMPLTDAQSQLQSRLDDQCSIKKWPIFKVEIFESIHQVLCIKGSGPHEIAEESCQIIVDNETGTAVLRGADIFQVSVIVVQKF